MISNFYNVQVVIKRMIYGGSDVGLDNNKASLSEIATVDCHLQQASPEYNSTTAESYKIDYLMWCPRDTDLQEGDTILQGSQKYTVRSIQDNVVGHNKHFEAQLVKA